MAIDHRVRGRAWMAAAALLAGVPAAFAAPLTLAPAVEREIIAPEGAQFQPSPADEEGAVDRFAEYTLALAKRDFAAAYAMLRLSWYLDPAGQPAGLYAAFDFRGDRKDGTMDCGYIVVHRAQPNAGWTVVRTDTSEVPPELIEDGVPKADVLRQLPCYLGKGIATAL